MKKLIREIAKKLSHRRGSKMQINKIQAEQG